MGLRIEKHTILHKPFTYFLHSVKMLMNQLVSVHIKNFPGWFSLHLTA
jgi:hypothetical protein